MYPFELLLEVILMDTKQYKNKKRGMQNAYLVLFGWSSWIRTSGMTESKSVALPLGYTPITLCAYCIT